MCYNCGCGNPQDDMGDTNNITEQTFAHMAEHSGESIGATKLSVYQLLQEEIETGKPIHEEHLNEMFEKAAKSWGQSVEDAKRKTYDLLKYELKKN
jgi:hypothetical protein